MLEAQRLRSMRHPHLIPVLESGVDDGVPYYVMPLAANGSLASRVGMVTVGGQSLVMHTVPAANCEVARDDDVFRDARPAAEAELRGDDALVRLSIPEQSFGGGVTKQVVAVLCPGRDLVKDPFGMKLDRTRVSLARIVDAR